MIFGCRLRWVKEPSRWVPFFFFSVSHHTIIYWVSRKIHSLFCRLLKAISISVLHQVSLSFYGKNKEILLISRDYALAIFQNHVFLFLAAGASYESLVEKKEGKWFFSWALGFWLLGYFIIFLLCFVYLYELLV